MSNLSTYYSFNQPDVNFNNQVVNWTTGSPVYDASLNGTAYISSQNYKTGNGSLQFPKNTFSTQGSLNTMNIDTSGLIGIAVSNDNLTMFICENNGKTYYYKRANTTVSFPSSKTLTNSSEVTRAYYRIATNSNASRFVACDNSYVYFSNWNSTNNNYNTLQVIENTLRSNCRGVSITPDGNKVVGCGEFGIIFTTWNTTNTNYDAFTNTLETVSTTFTGISISSNGNTIAYGGSNGYWYVSYWNGKNYNKGTAINSTALASTFEPRSTCFNNDASILFLSYYNNDTTNNTFYPIQYVSYNKNTNSYDTFSNINTTSIPKITNGYVLYCVDSSDKCTIYAASSATTAIYYCDLLYNTTSDNYCMIKSPTINTNGLTIACWFRSNYNSNNARIFDFASANTGTSNNIRLLINNNALQFEIYTSSNNTSSITGNINDNSWNHIAITMNYTNNNTSTITTYINGSTSGANTFSNKSYPNNVARPYSYLGKSNTGQPQFFGNIDDFRIYNSVLSQTDITNLYNNTNVTNNYKNSTVCRLYDTAAESTSQITPTPTTSNVGSSKTYYYWNDPYAATLAINNSANPYNFYYTYNNNSLYSQAKVSIITNELVTLKLNGLQTNILNSGNTFASPVQVPLIIGNNLFEFLTYNNSGPAYFATYVTDDSATPNYLFSTKFDTSEWKVNITGIFSNGYPLSSLLQNNYTSSTAITTTNYRTNNYDLSRNYTKGNVVASTNTNISNVAISNTYSDINNALFSYIAGPAPTTISDVTSNLKFYYKFNIGDILNNKFLNYATSLYDTSNNTTASISSSSGDYIMGNGSLDVSGTYYFQRNSVSLTTRSTFTISLWFKLRTTTNTFFLLNMNNGNDRITISTEKNGTSNLYIALELPPSSSQFYINTGTALAINTWYFLGWSVSGTTWNVRFNESTSFTWVPSLSAKTFTQTTFTNCFIGSENTNDRKFDGFIDDLRFYDTALSATELTTLNNYRN